MRNNSSARFTLRRTLDPRNALSYSPAVKRLFLALALLPLLSPSRGATPDLVNGIAVIVGEAVITFKDVQLAMADDLDTLERRYASNPTLLQQKAAELEKAKLEDMVENQLVLQEFKKAAYQIPESYFQGRIEEDIRKYGDRLTLTKTLQAEGITFETWRSRIREREILRLMWQQKVPHEPLISPTRIETYYTQHRDDFKMEDQVKLRMIVMTNTANSFFSPKKAAEEIIAKLDQKVPFEELARVYSNGSQAQQGGDWGWVQKTMLRDELRDAAFALEPGRHSGVIETPNAVYVMLVEDKKVSYTKSLTEVRDEIEGILRAEETKRLHKVWIDQLKSKAFVRYFN
jgi:parvulin-like peptidyl-prolyl isomerase